MYSIQGLDGLDPVSKANLWFLIGQNCVKKKAKNVFSIMKSDPFENDGFVLSPKLSSSIEMEISFCLLLV